MKLGAMGAYMAVSVIGTSCLLVLINCHSHSRWYTVDITDRANVPTTVSEKSLQWGMTQYAWGRKRFNSLLSGAQHLKNNHNRHHHLVHTKCHQSLSPLAQSQVSITTK